MFNLMKIGATIEIKPFAESTKDYVPAKFFMKNGQIWSSSSAVGTFPRDEMTEDTFTEHLMRMVNEGFQVIVHC